MNFCLVYCGVVVVGFGNIGFEGLLFVVGFFCGFCVVGLFVCLLLFMCYFVFLIVIWNVVYCLGE